MGIPPSEILPEGHLPQRRWLPIGKVNGSIQKRALPHLCYVVAKVAQYRH